MKRLIMLSAIALLGFASCKKQPIEDPKKKIITIMVISPEIQKELIRTDSLKKINK